METERSLRNWGMVLSVGLGVLLVAAVLGVVPGMELTSSSDAPSDSESDGASPAQEANNTTTEATGAGNVTVPIVDAMEAAQNETNGTAVGAELSREGDVTDLERPTRIYAVDVLLANDTQVVVAVNATDGTIRDVQRQENETGFFEGLFESDDGLPEDRPDLDSVRSAVDAVELVRTEAGENGTVTGVELTAEDDRLRYTVEVISGEGVQSTYVVAADPDEGGVLTTEPADAT